MNISRYLISLASFGAALFMGFKIGERVNPIESIFQSSLHITATPDVPIPNNNQFNLLIIGIDSIEKSDARLQSIWLVAYMPNSDKVTMLPIFPSPDNPNRNKMLAEAFQLDGSQPGAEFWDALQTLGIWWKGYIVSDLINTIKMIDAMGGIYIDEKLINGAQMVSSIPSWDQDPEMAIERQMLLLDSVCNRVTQNQTTTMEVINGMFLSKFQGGVQATSFVTKLSSLISTYRNLSCDFPTLSDLPAPLVSTNLVP